jgi:hypothetical protein
MDQSDARLTDASTQTDRPSSSFVIRGIDQYDDRQTPLTQTDRPSSSFVRGSWWSNRRVDLAYHEATEADHRSVNAKNNNNCRLRGYPSLFF